MKRRIAGISTGEDFAAFLHANWPKTIAKNPTPKKSHVRFTVGHDAFLRAADELLRQGEFLGLDCGCAGAVVSPAQILAGSRSLPDKSR